MRNENSYHIVVVAQDHKGWDQEKEPCYSHPNVWKHYGCFVLLIHLLLIVYVVSSHLKDQSIVGTFPSQLVESFRLIISEEFWTESIEIAVIGIVGGTALKPVHDWYDNNNNLSWWYKTIDIRHLVWDAWWWWWRLGFSPVKYWFNADMIIWSSRGWRGWPESYQSLLQQLEATAIIF